MRSNLCFVTETINDRAGCRGSAGGKLFGVWNTDDSNGLRLIHRQGRCWLEGGKILASGAGHIERPLVTATDENGRRLIELPKLGAPDRADLRRVGRRRGCALPRRGPLISGWRRHPAH